MFILALLSYIDQHHRK
ncbi:hypothetical protein [Lactobacillus sp. ESL0684]